MRKSDYDYFYNIIYKNNIKEKNKIISYKEIKEFLRDFRKSDFKTDAKYKKEKEIAELHAVSTGFMALAINSGKDGVKKEYKNDSVVYSSLLTNISNDILGIINLVDNGLEFQANILFRNLMELIYTFLTMLINKQKRKEYFDSARLENSYLNWQKNIKMSKLNEELANFEKDVFDEESQKIMKETRTEMYKHYSLYAHNDFISTYIGSYSINKDIDINSSQYANYNLFGTYNYGSKEILENVNELTWIYLMYFRNIIVRAEYFDKNNYISAEYEIYWNSGIMILLMLERELERKLVKKIMKKL